MRALVHPELWTIPGIGFPVRTWGFCVVVGFVVALWIALRRTRRTGSDAETVLSMALVGMILGVVGCRGMHVLHQVWRGGAGVEGVRSVQALPSSGGGEILGGAVLAVLGVVAYLAIRRRPIRLYLDVVFPPMVLAMGIGRIGCLMFGCCWGAICETPAGNKALPWAVRFPYGSPAFVRHWAGGKIDVPAELIWASPETNTPEPILRGVLNHCDIDGDSDLALWAQKAGAYAIHRQGDPDSADTVRLAAELAAARQVAGDHPREEFAASLHLQRLRSAGAAHLTWADLRAQAASQHSRWVHPTQVYDAVALVLLFFLLSALFRRRKRWGTVVAWTMILYPVNRILQEMIRADNPRDVLGFTVSQAASAVILLIGVGFLLVLRRGAHGAG